MINADKKPTDSMNKLDESLFRTVFDRSPDAFMLIDPCDPSGLWPIVDCNAAACLMSGYQREELIGQPIDIINAPTDTPTDRNNYLKQLREARSLNYEVFHRHKDGTLFPVEVSTTLINVGGRELVLGVDRDITKRNQSQELVQKERQHLLTILETIKVPTIISRLSDGIVLYANQAIAQISQVNLEKLVGFRTGNFYANPDDQIKLRQLLQERGQIDEFEILFRRTDGSVYWALLSSRIITYEGETCVLSTYIDITERKQIETELQQERNFSDAVINGMPGVFFVFDAKGNRIRWNKEYERVLGYTAEEFVTIKSADIMAEEDKERTLAAIQRAFREGRGNVEATIVTKSGKRIPYYYLAQRFQSGDQVYVAGTGIDISDRRQAESELQQEKTLSDAIINGLPGIFYLFDTQGKMLRWNKQYEEVSGYTTEEVAKKNALDLISDEDKERTTAAIQQAMVEGQATVEANVVTRDGKRIPYYFVGQRFQIGDQIYLAGAGIDITERKQAEQALTENEERFRRFTEATLEGLIFHERGIVIDVNPAAATMIGSSDGKALIGRNLLEFIVPEYHQLVLSKMQSETVQPYEIQCIHADGSIFPVETSTRAYKVGDREIRASSMRDITARKQAEKAVSESEARFRSLFDQANDAIFLTQGPTIVDCNLATAKIFGAQPEQIIGQTPLTFSPEIQPDGQNSEEKAIALINLALAGQPQSFQWKHKQLDGTPFDAEISLNRVEIGQEFYVQAFIRDISERKQAEIKLQQEQALSEAIINGLPGVFYLFDPQGKMFRWNKQYEQMMGFTPEEAAATNAIDAFPDEEKEHVMTAIQRVFVEGQATVETNFLTKHGKRIPHYLTGLVLQVGDQVYLAGTGIDITERKRLEAQVQEAYERRGLQVQLSTQVSQSIASASSLEELYDRVVTQVKEQFGYYHTQLLRYDPAQDAVVLVTGYGETGVKMLAAGHRLPMGEGLIGTAAASGETVLRPALENDPDWHANPLLPETKGEIAVPIKLGNTVLGVLDVQSNAAGALDADDQLLLEGLCGQIAVAVESTRLAQEMSERLEEINRLYRAMSQEGWKAYRGSAELPEGFIYDQKGLRPIEASGLADELFANVPLTVPGGETIGTLAIAEDPQRLLSAEDEVFLQQVSEQVALALESARLFEQTQEALNWQQAINHTSILIGQAKSVSEITRATAELLPLLGMMSCSINVIRETDANGAPTSSDIHIARFVDNEFVSMAPILGQPSEGWLPSDMAYYQKNRVTVFPNLDDISTMIPFDAYQAPGAIAYMRKVGMRSAITLALGVQSRPIGYLTFNSRAPLAHLPEKYITWLGTIVDLISTSIDGQLLLTETEQGRQTLARRAAELETVATVSTTASTVLDPDKLLQAVVDLTKERFDLYHTHIYTYDAAWNTLLLAAGAGEVGRKLVAEEHAIPLTLEQSLVARAARERKPVIVNDVRSEPGFLPNPLLPETRAEMAVPMTVGDTLLGVFDVQSNNPTGFTDEDAMIYVTLAAQVGVALQNARSYVEQAALVTQLRELDKLKSSFLANMSHELRTPLNSILGFADVILEELDGPLTENMGNDLRLIQKNGQHLLHLINDVLDMAKIEAGRMNLNPERFTAFEVLDEVTSITSTLASEKNLALFIDPESDQNVKIFADRTRLRQVMINLVNNAIKFTENGKISLKLVSLEGARILITVKDTGIGIPPDKLDAVFQEFTQVDSSTTRKAGGTGLGLPISRRLVEMHGGRLWAESTGISGEGSTFYVELSVEARITETVEKQA